MQPGGSAAKLVLSEAGKPDITIEIGGGLTIGRSPANDLVLDDQSASRRHAEIRGDGRGRYTVIDAGSANGTWLNARRLTSIQELADGDVISIGNVTLRFSAPAVDRAARTSPHAETTAGTCLSFKYETAVILVTDIRNYSRMSEVLPAREFSLLIADWFKEGSEIIESRRGTIDKFIGDAVMAYWLVRDPANPAPEVDDALRAARDLIGRASGFAERLSARFPEHTFRIGIGINLGEAVVGNVGGGGHQSFTVVGDNVNVAFGLESLTKEKGCCVVVSDSVAGHAAGEFQFSDLGRAEVKGRAGPVSIWALKV